MSNEPNPDELIYSIATRQEANRRIGNQNSKSFVEMNFSAAPIKSPDTEIIFFIENTGYVSAEWLVINLNF
jgi:hypothetical protein